MRVIESYDPNLVAGFSDYIKITSEDEARARTTRDGRFRIACDSLDECRRILRHFRDSQTSDIAIPEQVTGLTSTIFLVSIPKSGTHLYMNLLEALGFHPGRELRDNIYEPGFWYFLRQSNAHTEAGRLFSDDVANSDNGAKDHPFQIAPCLFGFRYPHSMLFSEARFYRRPDSALFSSYYEGLSLGDTLRALLNDPYLRGRFVDRVFAFEPFFHFPNVIPVSFEGLCQALNPLHKQAATDLVWSLQLMLAVPGNPDDILSQAFGMESATKDQGLLIDPESRNHSIREIDPRLDDLCAQFGYAVAYSEAESPTSERCISNMQELPQLRFKRPEDIYAPVYLQANFINYHIIRYYNRVFGIPASAKRDIGVLEQIPEKDCIINGLQFFVGRSLEEIKLKIFGNFLLNHIANK